MRSLAHSGSLIDRASVELIWSKSRPAVLHTALACRLCHPTSCLLRGVLSHRFEPSDTLILRLAAAQTVLNSLIEGLLHLFLHLELALLHILMSCCVGSTIVGRCGCIYLCICDLVGLLIDELGRHCTEEASLCELARVERSLGWRRYKLSLALRWFQPKGLLKCSIGDNERIGHVLLGLLGL